MGKKKLSETKIESAENMVILLRENLDKIKDKRINAAFVDELDGSIREYLKLYGDIMDLKEQLKASRSGLLDKSYEIKDLMDGAKKIVKKELTAKKTKTKKKTVKSKKPSRVK